LLQFPKTRDFSLQDGSSDYPFKERIFQSVVSS